MGHFTKFSPSFWLSNSMAMTRQWKIEPQLETGLSLRNVSTLCTKLWKAHSTRHKIVHDQCLITFVTRVSATCSILITYVAQVGKGRILFTGCLNELYTQLEAFRGCLGRTIPDQTCLVVIIDKTNYFIQRQGACYQIITFSQQCITDYNIII